ncbi:hypothetical protein CJ030_MR1G015719 [Morella rubra]|uniref:Uncharacterized protein n=1 Tax=Morella rubra TaxID=262757 RepID=A0A6A1WJG2_9ROSI|nr:hypothetical protein CJ030_MR1G015719 [Morella rubra]
MARNSLEQGWTTEIVEPNESSASWYGEPFASGIQGIRNHNPNVEEDDLYESWLENGKETEAPDIIPSKNMRYNEEPSETLGGSDEENRSVDGASGTRFQDKRGNEPATTSVDVGMRDNNDDIMVDADLFHKSIAQVKEPVSSKSATVPVSNDGSSGAEIVSATVVSGWCIRSCRKKKKIKEKKAQLNHMTSLMFGRCHNKSRGRCPNRNWVRSLQLGTHYGLVGKIQRCYVRPVATSSRGLYSSLIAPQTTCILRMIGSMSPETSMNVAKRVVLVCQNFAILDALNPYCHAN